MLKRRINLKIIFYRFKNFFTFAPMMMVNEIKLFELLKARMGEKEAEAFVEILEKKVDQKFEYAKQMLATKEDLADVKIEIIKWLVGMIIGLFVALTGTFIAIIKLLH